jgi:hypothetical protein
MPPERRASTAPDSEDERSAVRARGGTEKRRHEQPKNKPVPSAARGRAARPCEGNVDLESLGAAVTEEWGKVEGTTVGYDGHIDRALEVMNDKSADLLFKYTVHKTEVEGNGFSTASSIRSAFREWFWVQHNAQASL